MVQADEQVRTYGGWRRSRGMGLMGLGSAQTLVVLIALTTLIISVSVSATAGMVAAGLLGLGFALSVVVVRTNQVLTGLAVVPEISLRGCSAPSDLMRARSSLRTKGLLKKSPSPAAKP